MNACILAATAVRDGNAVPNRRPNDAMMEAAEGRFLRVVPSQLAPISTLSCDVTFPGAH